MAVMKEAMHPYENLSLSTVGLLVALWLIAMHSVMLFKADWSQGWLKRLPRHYNAGVFTMTAGLLWFWLLVAPDIRGTFDWLGALSMDLGEFNFMKKPLQLAIPITCIGLCMKVPEFLFVRGLGVLCMMVAAPMLESAFLKEPGSRVVLSLLAYVILTKGLFWVAMPYLFRDAVTWATAEETRWKILSAAGLLYGILVLVLSLSAWKGF
jgi:hypothetical protein